MLGAVVNTIELSMIQQKLEEIEKSLKEIETQVVAEKETEKEEEKNK